ncbi:hypothetical protein PFLUV_G00171280 [Perca fluviatilis]|uniref:C-type lectin domain-containing protein n=1 Tax=Perca fluviatilis TaxID=8168 RepID=A0A6A5EQK4_PERFL|nr:C-type lectin domain family 10 member A-like [Perca fluviatilis]KAF1381125.1 hypothetical protein PFLUV_G00171280 [Perca fluviatilis]
MADYYNEREQDSSTLWIKEPVAVSLSAVSRFRHWLFPALTATFILVLIIALGASNTKTSNQLWSVEQRVSNLSHVIQSLNTSLQHAQETSKQVHQLQVAMDNNKNELMSVAEALKQLAVIDSLSRSVASLKCSLERIINNSSTESMCCPPGWVEFGSSCYFFSRESRSWNESRVWCEKRDAHLLILQDDKTWNFVTRRTVPLMYWVGLSDWRTGRWEWINQTPYTMERRRWEIGQPDSWTEHGLGPGDEDCAQLYYTGRLNDIHCSTAMRYICQKHGTHA